MIKLGGFQDRKPNRRMRLREFLSLPEVKASNLVDVLVIRLFAGQYTPALGFRWEGKHEDYDVLVPVSDRNIFGQIVRHAKGGGAIHFIIQNVDGAIEWGIELPKDEHCVWEKTAWGWRAVLSSLTEDEITL
ncbi:hypothetical protein [Hydrogenobacter thermophilus]|uniref:hypothetical protein n=1 Tax=Hydrogenobacter thermophilus TaxID=940 RepID=UPI0030F7A486